jgi:hypothetical protein
MKFLSAIDIFGHQPTMMVNNSKTYKSPFGGFLSFSAFIAVCYSVWVLGNDIIYRQKPNLITSTYADALPLRTDFNDRNYIITFGLQQPDFKFFYDETIYTFKVENLEMLRFPNSTETFRTDVIDVVKCSDKKLDFLYEDYFSNLDLKNLACMKNGTFVLEGQYGTAIWRWVYISLQKCKNSTSNNFHCKSKQEIDKKLSGGYFGMFLSDQTVIPTNYTHPFKSFGVNIWTSFTDGIFREVWLYYKKMQILSDMGWLTESTEMQDSFGYDSFKEIWDKRDTSDVMMRIGIGMGLNRVVYERSYLKMQQIAANVGGIFKFLMMCGEILSFHYRKFRFESWIVKYFYEMSEISQENSIVNESGLKPSESRNHFIKVKNKLSLNSPKNSQKENLNMSIEKKHDKKLNSIGHSKPLNNEEKNIINKEINFKNFKDIKFEKVEKHISHLNGQTNCDFLTSVACPKSFARKREKQVKSAYSNLQARLQWINYFKIQNDLEKVKEIILDEDQTNILDLSLMLKKKTPTLYVKYILIVGYIY